MIERTGREGMVLLLGLCREMSERMIDAVKEFLEKMWYARSRNYASFFSVYFPFLAVILREMGREMNEVIETLKEQEGNGWCYCWDCVGRLVQRRLTGNE